MPQCVLQTFCYELNQAKAELVLILSGFFLCLEKGLLKSQKILKKKKLLSDTELY